MRSPHAEQRKNSQSKTHATHILFYRLPRQGGVSAFTVTCCLRITTVLYNIFFGLSIGFCKVFDKFLIFFIKFETTIPFLGFLPLYFKISPVRSGAAVMRARVPNSESSVPATMSKPWRVPRFFGKTRSPYMRSGTHSRV